MADHFNVTNAIIIWTVDKDIALNNYGIDRIIDY